MFHSGGMASGTNQNSILKGPIQEVEVTIAGGATSGSVTLGRTVKKTKTLIFPQGVRTANGANRNEWQPRVELFDGSTVKAYTNAAGASDRIVRASIMECADFALVGDVIHGTVDIVPGEYFAQVSNSILPCVNIGNSNAIHLGETINTVTQELYTARAFLSPSFGGGLFLERGNGPGSPPAQVGTLTVGYCYFEFAPSVLDTRANWALTNGVFNTQSSSWFLPITPDGIDISRGITFPQGMYVNNIGAFQQSECVNWIAGGGGSLTFNSERIDVSSNDSWPAIGYIQFKKKWIRSIQRFQPLFLAAETSHDVALSGIVDVGRVLTTYGGFKAQNGFANIEYIYPTIETVDATKARMKRNAANGVYGAPVNGYTPPKVALECTEFY